MKSSRNLKKHRIRFATASLVFEDPHMLVQQDRVVEGEERWQALGSVGGAVIVMVVHPYREEGGEEVVRIISPRKAASPERKAYEEAYKKSN